MKTWILWHGGSSYAPGYVDDDTEEFSSLKAGREEFRRREEGCDPYYPCVSDSSAHVFFHDPRGENDPYPDKVFRFEEGRFVEEIA